MSGRKVWAIIPARYGSTRLPGKALLPLAGKPIFAHAAARAHEAGVEASCIAIATDDERIAMSATKYGIRAVMTGDHHESGSDRVLEAAQNLPIGDRDLVINLQGDEPYIPSKLIVSLIEYAMSSTFEISTACVPLEDSGAFLNENTVKVVVGDKGRAIYFSRAGVPYERGRKSGFGAAFRHVGIYSYTLSALKTFCSLQPPELEMTEKLEQLRALYYGIEIGCIKYSGEVPYGIDTESEYQHLLAIYGE